MRTTTSSVTVAGLRVGVPATAASPTRGGAAPAPKPAPSRGSWTTCPACANTGDGSCPACGGSGVIMTPHDPPPAPQVKATAPAPVKKAPARKAPAKKTAAKTDPAVTAKPVETIEAGQLVRWSTADLLDPEGAGDEVHWWPVPEGVWRVVNSVTPETNQAGDPILAIEYAASRYSDGDYDERIYAPGTVLATKPPTFATHTIGSVLKVGDRIRVGGEVWVIHADGLEQQ